MTRVRADSLNLHYKQLQEKYRVVESAKYADLVTANGNHLVPVHRWFRMKESYSSRLLPTVLEDLGLKVDGLRCLDPFTGSGTTLTSLAQEAARRPGSRASFVGTEVNPFLHLLSSTKLRALQNPPPDLLTFAGAVARVAIRGKLQPATPSLSTFSNADYFNPLVLAKLLQMVAAVDELSCGAPNKVSVDLTRLAVASIVEPVSNLRRDGRTLRLVQNKQVFEPVSAFLEAVERIDTDLPVRRSSVKGTVRLVDARKPTISDPAANLAIFSPPYPNNIDYSEVYKLEAWLLGLVSTQEDFSALRRRTVRSHASLRWGNQYRFLDAHTDRALLQPILDAIPADRYTRGRAEVVLGYADDMLAVLRNIYANLASGGYFVCVVGNSLHGRGDDKYVIASDLIISELAELAGFRVQQIAVARYPRRRRTDSEYLRESLVVGRKVP